MLTPLSPGDPSFELVSRWLSTYIVRPHPELGRRGSVCPFVAQALATDSVSLVAFRLGPDPDVERMNDAIAQGIERFRGLARDEGNASLASLIVVFDDLESEHWHLVDDAHRASKPAAVRLGLMLGQFHPRCDAPAAHNERFLVNRAPVPLIVVRQMAPHDVLFLEQDPEWLEHYRATLARRGIPVDPRARRATAGRGAT